MISFKGLLARHWILFLQTFLTLFIYSTVFIPPEKFWPAALVSHLIPLFIVINGLILIFLLIKRKRTATIPLSLLLISWSFLSGTLTFHDSQPIDNAIQILSFNTKLFRKPNTYSQFSIEMIQWVARDSSDIKCLQEYSTNATWPLLDVTAQIKQKGYQGYTFRAKVIDSDHSPGMAIFSKFDLLDSGVVFQDNNTLNAAIYADLNVKGKVIRVYNVHLASMNLELNKTSPEEVLPILKRLKSGSIKRSNQMKVLIAHTQSSPYPFILCGDFNETPYSYTYFQLKAQFKNAFEEAGNGFGFTFNEIPYVLRIDHQFYRPDIHAVGYRVNRSMNISDHFPTYGYYLIP